MRKAVIILGAVIILIVIGAVVFVATINPNDYWGTIQARLQQQLNRNVGLGNMDLRLFPLSFRVANLSIADDPTFQGSRPFIRTQELSVSVKLLPLLRKSVQIDSLSLQHPSIELIKNAQGVWNFASLGREVPGGPPANRAATAKAPSERAPSASSGSGSGPGSSVQQQLLLKELTIEDGQIAITDLQERKPRTVYDHVNLKLSGFTPDAPFDIEAAVQLPGPGNQQVKLHGRGGPFSHVNPVATPFKGTLDLKGVGLAGLQQFLQSPALAHTDGLLSGHTTIDSRNGRLSASGQMLMEKPRLLGFQIGYPISADYGLSDDLTQDMLSITRGALKLGPTPISITGAVNSKATPAQLDLTLVANNVSITEAARLAAAAGMAFSPGTTVNGRISANIQARGAADKPVLNGTLGGRDILISGNGIAKPVQVKALNVALSPTQIRSDTFNVSSGGTTAAGQFTLTQYASSSPQVDASLRAPRAALPELLSIAKAYGVTGLDKISGAGTLGIDLHAAGPLKAISSDQIVRALNGNIDVNLNNVHYAGVDLSYRLESLLSTVPAGRKDQGFTNFQKMTGNVVVKNGVAQTTNLEAALDIANVGAAGTADLASEALNLHLNAVFSKAFSQQAGAAKMGGQNVGNLVSAALTNNQGEMVVPAIVTGTFGNPRFTPDTERMAQMKLKGLMPTGDNPLGGASSLLGGLLGQKGQTAAGQQQQQQQQKQNPVDEIMGLFSKKKKQP
ncbi:MAG TPA: AsmA family protein [Terriglobia bacterium]|nr:AsmA family protein [Terriglobia bacterium]